MTGSELAVVARERARRRHPLTAVAEPDCRPVDESDAAGVAGSVQRVLALLADDAVAEVVINGPGEVRVERNGHLVPAGFGIDGYGIEVLIEKVLVPLGLRADRTSPIVDARLADGSRFAVVLAPPAVVGPVVTIRRFTRRPLPLDRFGPPDMVAILEKLVECRSRLLVVGATSSGKTSLLNALLARCDPGERVVCIEDTAELHLVGDDQVRLEARPANREGVGAVTMHQLVTAAMRLRPDRLVVGEVRGAEAFDLLLALSSGHDGSMATCHAASVPLALDRLEALAALASARLGSDVASVARRFIHQALDAVIVVARGGDGARSVIEIASVPDQPGAVPTTQWRAQP